MLRAKNKDTIKKKPSPTPASSEVERLLRGVLIEERRAERRGESRIATSIVVAVVPCPEGEPVVDGAFVTFTKNISADGISLVVNRPVPDYQVLVGFPGQGMISFVWAEVLHREALPLGCFKLGLRMSKLVDASQYPDLAKIGRRQ
jgi:hypothetical protein